MIPPVYRLWGFDYELADGSSQVTIEGPPLHRYKLITAANLDFENPDANPLPLIAAATGSLDGNHVITEANGRATVHFNLGTAPANFFRAESLGPVTATSSSPVPPTLPDSTGSKVED